MNIATPNVPTFAEPSAPDHAASAAEQARELASREAARIGDMARDWWRRNARTARDLAGTAKEEVAVAADRTRRYVRDEPLRSVAVAAAAGAAIAALLLLFGRSRRH